MDQGSVNKILESLDKVEERLSQRIVESCHKTSCELKGDIVNVKNTVRELEATVEELRTVADKTKEFAHRISQENAELKQRVERMETEQERIQKRIVNLEYSKNQDMTSLYGLFEELG